MKKQTIQKSRSSRWEQSFRKPKEGEWYISGINGVRESLASDSIKVKRLWVDRKRLGDQLGRLLHSFQGEIEQMRGGDTPFGPLTQGVGALVNEPDPPELDQFVTVLIEAGKVPLLVTLDQVEDPMNLGQILRTCEGAGVDGVVLLRHRSVHLNQTVAQVSQGAFAWVPVFEVTNLRNSLELLKELGLWIIGCEGGDGSRSWAQCDFREPLTLVMGAEGKGLRSLTRKTCDTIASLPMRGRLNSLNVGAATAAFLYEVLRQRG